MGIPVPKDSERLKGIVASIAIHGGLLLLALLGTRVAKPDVLFPEASQGAGGINLPAGGGGGGTRGTGGRSRPERVDFVQLQEAVVPKVEPVKKPEEVKPKPPTVKPPEEKPPEVKPPEVQIPPVQTPPVATASTSGSIDTTLTGRGGGSGNDGTAGNGPGTGGGIGSGIGTGRGSGVGPGTGGGPGTIYPPQPTQVVLLPSDIPAKVRPYELKAEFVVDSLGNVTGYRFNPSRDRGWDRKVDATLKSVKFRPGTDWQGRPVTATAVLQFIVK